MHTDNLKSILADHLGIDISQLTDDRSLGDLGLDEVDIEELLLALEEELDTASDAPTFAPDSRNMPFKKIWPLATDFRKTVIFK